MYLTARYYETRGRVKYETDRRLCKDVIFISKHSGHRSSSSQSCKRGMSDETLITIAALAFAFTSPEDEKSSISESITNYYNIITEHFATLLQKLNKDKAPTTKDIPVEEELPPPIEDHTIEIPPSFYEIEKRCSEISAKLIARYKEAISVVQEYHSKMMEILEMEEDSKIDIIHEMKKITKASKIALNVALDETDVMSGLLNRIIEEIDSYADKVPQHMMETLKKNILIFIDDIEKAKEEFEAELRKTEVSEQYWQQITAARERFTDELKILFPGIGVDDLLPLNQQSFYTFIWYMNRKIAGLSKELAKMQTINKAKLISALKSTDESLTEEAINVLISLEVDKHRHMLEEMFSKKLLEEQKKFQDNTRNLTKSQSDIHRDQIKEVMTSMQQEFSLKMNRRISEQVEIETLRQKNQLAVQVAKSLALEKVIEAYQTGEVLTKSSQVLWAACQALARSANPPLVDVPSAVTLKPLEPEIEAIFNAAPKDDVFVSTVIKGVPTIAVTRGVYPEYVLRERFLKVENVARSLAMVSAEGAPLYVYLLSYLQSFLIISRKNSIPKRELRNEPIDVSSLNTFDILHRARYWVDRGNLKMALRYMNLLKGGSRSVALDWMHEVKVFLETQMVVETLLTYANLASFITLKKLPQPMSTAQ